MIPRGLAPSVISADTGRFGDHLRSVEPHAVRWHVDIMDGHYVPNLTIGPPHVRAIASISSLPQDVHMMVSNPDDTWEWYAKAGAARIAFHPETSPDAARLLEAMRAAGIGAGLAVNPDVPATDVKEFLGLVDHLVVMSDYPGFSAQAFNPDVLPKLRELRSMADDGGVEVCLVVDGGVSPATAPACVDAGADVLVSASAVFTAPDPASVAAELRAIAERSIR